MKRFTERLLELERKARETVVDNKCNQNITSKTDNIIRKPDRSFKTNDDQLSSNVYQQQIKNNSSHAPVQNSINTK